MSIKDVKVSNTFSLALSEDGRIFSWGSGLNGHLGQSDEISKIQPEEIKISFKDEEKKIKKLKRKHRDMDEVEELLTLHNFVKSASKRGGNMAQPQSFIEQECIISLHNMGSDNLNDLFLIDNRNSNLKHKNHTQHSFGKKQQSKNVQRMLN